jgi:hypothetical protein
MCLHVSMCRGHETRLLTCFSRVLNKYEHTHQISAKILSLRSRPRPAGLRLYPRRLYHTREHFLSSHGRHECTLCGSICRVTRLIDRLQAYNPSRCDHAISYSSNDNYPLFSRPDQTQPLHFSHHAAHPCVLLILTKWTLTCSRKFVDDLTEFVGGWGNELFNTESGALI